MFYSADAQATSRRLKRSQMASISKLTEILDRLNVMLSGAIGNLQLPKLCPEIISIDGG